MRYTIPFLLACNAAPLAAQTLTAVENLPPVNATYAYRKAAYSDPEAPGAAQLIDRTGLVQTGTATIGWVSPTVYSDPSAFPTASIASISGADTIFYRLNGNAWERVGERQIIFAFDVEIPLSDPSINLDLPLSFGDTWNDNITGSFLIDASPGTRTGTISGSVDASGSLLLPGIDPVDVVRVNTYTQEVNVFTEVPVFGTVTVVHKRRQYDYYGQFMKTPLMRVYTDSLVSSIGLNIVDSAILYLEPSMVGMLEAQAGGETLRVFPDPATDELNIPATGLAAGTILRIMDASGRLVRTERLGMTGAIRPLDVAGLAPGLYTLQIGSGAEVRSVRFTKR